MKILVRGVLDGLAATGFTAVIGGLYFVAGNDGTRLSGNAVWDGRSSSGSSLAAATFTHGPWDHATLHWLLIYQLSHSTSRHLQASVHKRQNRLQESLPNQLHQ